MYRIVKDNMQQNDCHEHCPGFTLVELLVVIFFVALVASLATLRFGDTMEKAKIRTAEADLATIREAFVGSSAMPGYLADMENIPGFSPAWLRIHNLLTRTNIVGRDGRYLDSLPGVPDEERKGYADFSVFTNWNPMAQRGWRGPYLQSGTLVKNTVKDRKGLFPGPNDKRRDNDETFEDRGFFPRLIGFTGAYAYGQGGEEAMADPWGNPYVLQVPPEAAFESSVSDEERFRYARVVSAGPNGRLETPCYDSGTLSKDRQKELRLAGVTEPGVISTRGDDIVLFLNRTDIFEDNE